MLIRIVVETTKMMEIQGSYITLRQVWANRHKVDGAKTNTELVKSTLVEDLYHDIIKRYILCFLSKLKHAYLAY